MKVHFQVVVVVDRTCGAASWCVAHIVSGGRGVVVFIYIYHTAARCLNSILSQPPFLLKNFILMDDSTRLNPTHFPWFIPLPLFNEIFLKGCVTSRRSYRSSRTLLFLLKIHPNFCVVYNNWQMQHPVVVLSIIWPEGTTQLSLSSFSFYFVEWLDSKLSFVCAVVESVTGQLRPCSRSTTFSGLPQTKMRFSFK